MLFKVLVHVFEERIGILITVAMLLNKSENEIKNAFTIPWKHVRDFNTKSLCVDLKIDYVKPSAPLVPGDGSWVGVYHFSKLCLSEVPVFAITFDQLTNVYQNRSGRIRRPTPITVTTLR